MIIPDSFYIGRHAELYDLFYANKPYAEEAQFVHECIQRYIQGSAHRLLDLACGTGSHAFEFERFDYQVIATDYSTDMLKRARRKARVNGSQIEFLQQDMCKLNVPEQPFDVVTCLFDSIGYVVTNENILLVLKGIHSHLRSGGVFIFEFWHAPAMLKHYEPVRIKRWKLSDKEIMRISETELDYANQQARVTYTVYEFLAAGTYKAFSETQVNRYFLLQEMKGWLSAAGLQMIKAFAGFKNDENISDSTWHVVAVARPIVG